jgi:hypothetical protein
LHDARHVSSSSLTKVYFRVCDNAHLCIWNTVSFLVTRAQRRNFNGRCTIRTQLSLSLTRNLCFCAGRSLCLFARRLAKRQRLRAAKVKSHVKKQANTLLKYLQPLPARNLIEYNVFLGRAFPPPPANPLAARSRLLAWRIPFSPFD